MARTAAKDPDMKATNLCAVVRRECACHSISKLTSPPAQSCLLETVQGTLTHEGN